MLPRKKISREDWDKPKKPKPRIIIEPKFPIKSFMIFIIIAIVGGVVCGALDCCSKNNSTGPRSNVHSRFQPVDSLADSLGN